MKLSTLLLLFLLSIISLDLSAQHNDSDRNTEIGLSIGYAHGYFKDLNYSPLNYKQGGLTYSLYFARKSKNKKSFFKAQLDYTSGEFTTKTSELFTIDSPSLVDLQIEYLRRLDTSNSQLSIYVGGQIRSNMNYFIFGDFDAFTYLFAYSFGATAIAEYQINDTHKIYAGLSIPLMSHLVRPPLTGHDKESEENEGVKLLFANGGFASFNKYLAIDFNLGYQIELSERWNLHLKYKMRYQRTNVIHLSKHLQNHFSVGTSLKF